MTFVIDRITYTMICMFAGVGLMHILQLAQIIGALGVGPEIPDIPQR